MSVARVTEIISSSDESFEDAVKKGVRRASKTLKNVRGAWVEGQKVTCDSDGRIDRFAHPAGERTTPVASEIAFAPEDPEGAPTFPLPNGAAMP